MHKEDWIAEKKRSIDVAKDCLQEVMIRQATSADRHRQERRFEAGQRVLVQRDHIGSRGSDEQPCAKLRRKNRLRVKSFGLIDATWKVGRSQSTRNRFCCFQSFLTVSGFILSLHVCDVFC